jgi:uncharacterized protein YjiS (DUF1127 family)
MLGNTYIGTQVAAYSPSPSRQLTAAVRIGVIETWFQRSRQRRALAELDDRLLDDIDVTRSKAQQEATKPFWSAGKA